MNLLFHFISLNLEPLDAFFFFSFYSISVNSRTMTRQILYEIFKSTLEIILYTRISFGGKDRRENCLELSDNQEAENKKWPFPAERERNEIDSFIKATGLYFNRTRGANCAWILNGALHFVEAATEPRVSAAIAQTNFLRDAIVSLFLLN